MMRSTAVWNLLELEKSAIFAAFELVTVGDVLVWISVVTHAHWCVTIGKNSFLPPIVYVSPHWFKITGVTVDKALRLLFALAVPMSARRRVVSIPSAMSNRRKN